MRKIDQIVSRKRALRRARTREYNPTSQNAASMQLRPRGATAAVSMLMQRMFSPRGPLSYFGR